MALLDAIIETTSVSLPGQDRPAPAPRDQAPAPPPRVAGLDERHLQQWRAALEAEIRQRAVKCLTETFDRKNNCSKSASPAMREARAAFIRRVEDANFGTLLEMLKWADSADTKDVYAAFDAVAQRFDKPAPAAPRPRM